MTLSRIIILHVYTPRERWSGGLYRNHSVCPSVCLSIRLSVQIRARPITFLWFDIGLPYLAHGCITMRRCVVYIRYSATPLNFDLKAILSGF